MLIIKCTYSDDKRPIAVNGIGWQVDPFNAPGFGVFLAELLDRVCRSLEHLV